MGEMLFGLVSQPLWVFVTVLARISPALMLTPPTRSAAVPMHIRALIAISIAALISPLAMADASVMPIDLFHMIIALAAEVFLGILLGSIILLAIICLQIAGQSIGHLAGFDMAMTVDPGSNEEMPVVANMLGWLSMALLLLIGGHRQLMECCLQSFERYPAGAIVIETNWLAELEEMVQHSFVIGIRAAAPLATALLLSNLITGLLARTLPQLNILAIGFNINVLSLLVLLSLSLGSVSWIYQEELSSWLDTCFRVVVADPRET